MRDFRNNLKKTGRSLLFFLILLLLLQSISGILDTAALNHVDMVQSRNKSRVMLAKEPEDTIDVLILGDSLSYAGISPMQMWNSYGLTSFVAAQSGQNIQESYYMLKKAYENQHPKIVVLETNVIFRPQKGIQGITMSLAAMGCYYFPVFAYHDIWKAFVTDKEYPEENYKGFQFREVINPYTGGDYMKETKGKERITEMVLGYLDKIQALCRKNHSQLVLASTPSPMNYNYKKYNALKNYAEKKGLDYVDMNLRVEELGIDWELDSLDMGDHLNLSGASKVSSFMGRYLTEHYQLPDRREEKNYGDWKAEGEKYQERAREKLEAMRKNVKMSEEGKRKKEKEKEGL